MIFFSKLVMILNEFAPYLIIGFLFSGVLSIVLTVEIVQKYLGKKNFFSIFTASILGVPLPLCSCGVIPVSAYLRNHGASKGATTSFLISTPQTGIDSILITYGMLGPFFAIYRPIVAFISGIFGGSLVHILDNDLSATNLDNCSDDCCDDTKSKSLIYRILDYGFIRLPLDIVNPLIFGIILSALIVVYIPHDYFGMFGTGFVGMMIMLVLGLPTYVCATASVPLAFALYTKGFSLGAMLVFLMVGPATNITTMSVIYKILGKKNLAIYLFSITFCALMAGLILDFIITDQMILSDYNASHIITSNMQVICSIVLVVVLLNSLRIKYFSSSNMLSRVSENKLIIDGMTCSHCVESVKKSIQKIKGISSVSVHLESGEIRYTGDDTMKSEIIKSIESLGYKVKE